MLKAADVQNAKAKTRYDDTGNIQAQGWQHHTLK